jgi:hypothetical protein
MQYNMSLVYNVLISTTRCVPSQHSNSEPLYCVHHSSGVILSGLIVLAYLDIHIASTLIVMFVPQVCVSELQQ